MKIDNNSYLISTLEAMFAENFNSPIFPFLAKHYLDRSLTNKALKVSEVGLDNNPNNYLGQYILSQIYIINNKLLKSEKLLMAVVKYQPCNIKAMLALIKLKISLGRSEHKIRAYIYQAFFYFPYNHEIKKMYKKYYLPSKQNKTIKKIIENDLINDKKLISIRLDTQLATKSLYNVFINQKKYIVAKQILDLMSKNKKYKIFVSKENKKLSEVLNKKEK